MEVLLCLQVCNVVPPSCIQMRNLILSAFPRNMRLPDPFTPNLKVDLLPEIGNPPRFRPPAEHMLPAQMRAEVMLYLCTCSGTISAEEWQTFCNALDCLKLNLLLICLTMHCSHPGGCIPGTETADCLPW